MIQITPQMRVLVAVEAVDFRRGIDGLAQLCRVALQTDPFMGAVFVFRSRRRTAIKLLVWQDPTWLGGLALGVVGAWALRRSMHTNHAQAAAVDQRDS